MTLLGSEVLADDQINMRSLGWILIHCDWYPYKKGGYLDTETDNMEER